MNILEDEAGVVIGDRAAHRRRDKADHRVTDNLAVLDCQGHVSIVDIERRVVHVRTGIRPSMAVQINRSVDAAGMEGCARGVITQQNDCFSARGLCLEGIFHGVVLGLANLAEIRLFYAVLAFAVLLDSRTFDNIRGRVNIKCTAGNANGSLCRVLKRNQPIVVRVSTQRAGDCAAGDGDASLLALRFVIGDGSNVAVDCAAADFELADCFAVAVDPSRNRAVDCAAFDRSAEPVFNCVAVFRSNRAAVQEEITTVNLDRNEVVLPEVAALDGQTGILFNRIIANADEGCALYADDTAVVGHVAALKRQPAVALNVDDIVRGNAGVLRGILALDRTGLISAGIHDSHSSRDSQRGLALHLTAVERMAVQIERQIRCRHGDIFCRVRNQLNSLFSACRVDGFLEGLILLAVDFSNHNDLCKRLAVFTVHPLVAVGSCNVNRRVLRDSDLVTVAAVRNGAVYFCTRAKRERCVIRIAIGLADFNVAIDRRVLNGNGNASVGGVAADVERASGPVCRLCRCLTGCDRAILDQRIAAVVGNRVAGFLAADDGHLLERQIRVVLNHYGWCACPICRFVASDRRITIECAVLEGDLVVLIQLEAVARGAGAANENAANRIGVVIEVNNQALISESALFNYNTIAGAVLKEHDGVAVLGCRKGRCEGLVLGIADLRGESLLHTVRAVDILGRLEAFRAVLGVNSAIERAAGDSQRAGMLPVIIGILNQALRFGVLKRTAGDGHFTNCVLTPRYAEQKRRVHTTGQFECTACDACLIPVHDNALRGVGERTAVDRQLAELAILDGVDAAGEQAALDSQRSVLHRIVAIADHAGEMAFIGDRNAIFDRKAAALVVQDGVEAVAVRIIRGLSALLAAGVGAARKRHGAVVDNRCPCMCHVVNLAALHR